MTGKLNIAVAGAGVAGLASALYLHRLGHAVCVIDRFKKSQPLGSGLMLQPTGLTVLHDLGLSDRIFALGNRIDRLVGQDSRSGRNVLDVSYDTQRTARFGLAVHRAALFDVLHDAVCQAGIEFVLGCEVDAFKLTEHGISLPTVQPERDFDLIVDATGASSKLRPVNVPGGVRGPLQYGALWTTLNWEDCGFDPHALQQRYDKASIMIGILPIGRQVQGGQQKAALFWSLKHSDVDNVRAAGLDRWKAGVRKYWPEIAPFLDQIRDFDELSTANYGHHTMKQPFAKRIVHVGDSAHSTSPQLGQGANMALLDAAALAKAVERSSSLDSALELYGSSRKWHVKVFQFLSLALTPFYQSDSVVIPAVRDILMNTVGRTPQMQRVLSAMISGTLVDPFSAIGLAEKRFEAG